MPGAGKNTRPVKIMNANWNAGSTARADTVLVWDPDHRALIAANLRGTMPWTEHLGGEAAA